MIHVDEEEPSDGEYQMIGLAIFLTVNPCFLDSLIEVFTLGA